MSANPFDDIIRKNHFVVFYTSDNKISLDYFSTEDYKIAYVCVDDSRLHKIFLERFSKNNTNVLLPAIVFRGILIEGIEKDSVIEQVHKLNLSYYTNLLDKFKNKSDFFFVIKGTVEKPYCKFTKQLLAFCNENNIDLNKIGHMDIFTDGVAREYFKMITGWPTYPMVFYEGKFIGGLDKFKEMILKSREINFLNYLLLQGWAPNFRKTRKFATKKIFCNKLQNHMC